MEASSSAPLKIMQRSLSNKLIANENDNNNKNNIENSFLNSIWSAQTRTEIEGTFARELFACDA